MQKYVISLLAICFLALSCSRVPLTGRKQLSLLPESELAAMSLAAYNDFLTENEVVPNSSNDARMVARVGSRLALSVEQILKAKGGDAILQNIDWEFKLVKDDLVNAWAMPGGKVVIYTGILPVTKDETGLAVVMSHELAHAIAKHGNERVSQGLLAQTGFAALDIAMANKPAETRQMIMMAAGIGTQVGVLLPFSRKHESEADELGLIFMANAGYDPSKAVDFWTRMNELSGAPPVPEFLSTHPSHATRIEDIRLNYLPQALTYYKNK